MLSNVSSRDLIGTSKNSHYITDVWSGVQHIIHQTPWCEHGRALEFIKEIINLMQKAHQDELGLNKNWPVTSDVVNIRLEKKPIWSNNQAEPGPSQLLVKYVILFIKFVNNKFRSASFYLLVKYVCFLKYISISFYFSILLNFSCNIL